MASPAAAPAPTSTRSRPRASSFRRRCLFILITWSAFLVFQELVFRFLFPLPESTSFNRIDYTPLLYLWNTQFGDTKKHGGLSNVKLRCESEPDGFAFDHRLNLYGFRGPDFSIEPPRDGARVLFIGDSFVEGWGAADEDTLPQQFARAVNRDLRVEAINLGVSGTGFLEYSRLVTDGVRLLRPQAVYLVCFANDLPAPRPPTELFAPARPEDDRPSPCAPRATQVLRRLADGLVIPSRFLKGPIPFVEPVPGPSNPLSRAFYEPHGVDPQVLDAARRGTFNPWMLVGGSEMEKHLRHDFSEGGGVEGYLQPLNELCHNEGARLIVVYLPAHVTVNPLYVEAQDRLGGGYGPPGALMHPRYRAQQAHLASVTRALGIPFLDTTDDFVRAEQDQWLFWPLDNHCNAAGYRLVAEICARHWRAQHALLEPFSPARRTADRQRFMFRSRLESLPGTGGKPCATCSLLFWAAGVGRGYILSRGSVASRRCRSRGSTASSISRSATASTAA